MTTFALPSTASWLMDHRAEANRALYVMGAVTLAAGAAVGQVGLERAVAALVWFGVLLLVLALPWTRWLRAETEETAWRARDGAAAHYRPPVL